MRPTTRSLALPAAATVAVLLLAGCSDDAAPSASPTPSATSEQSPTPSPSAEPSETPSPSPEPTAQTALPEEAMLTAAALGAPEGTVAVVTEPVDAWALPEACAAGAPTTAVVSRGLAYGDGAFESTVGIQQVAVFADADAASVEAQRLTNAVAACAGAGPDGQTAYLAEEVAVGAQGTGLIVDYYGVYAAGTGDESLGYYVVTTRRGNAVTLVGQVGGEATVGVSRENAVASTQAAWELLCVFDAEGCPDV